MKKILIKIIFALILLILAFLLCSCGNNEENNKICCFSSPQFAQTIAEALPQYNIQQKKFRQPLNEFTQGCTAVEIYAVNAKPLLQKKIGTTYYPCYKATVVIAFDKSRVQIPVHSWHDLTHYHGAINIYDDNLEWRVVYACLGYAFKRNVLDTNAASNYLKILAQNGALLDKNQPNAPIQILFDYQAVQMAAQNHNWQFVVPAEGTLSFEAGLLTHNILIFDRNNLNSALITAGYRLPDGSCNAAYYPNRSSYQFAATASPEQMLKLGDVTAHLRRQVFGTHHFATANFLEHQFSYLLFLIILIIWIAFTQKYTVQNGIKKGLLWTGIILIGWACVYIIKRNLSNEFVITRYMWYLFYPFMLALPVNALYIAWAVNKSAEICRPPKWLWYCAAISTLLSLLVLTNDFHQLVFKFNSGFENWNDDYHYGPAYLPIALWFALPSLFAYFQMLWKGYKSPKRKRMFLPFCFVILCLLYNISYSVGLAPSHLSLLIGTGTCIVLIWTSSIWTGLIPSNRKYKALFEASTLGFQLLNSDGISSMRSVQAPVLTPNQRNFLAKANNDVSLMLDENTLLWATPIAGGAVVWQDDISQITKILQETQFTIEQLEKGNQQLKYEADIRSEMLSLNYQNQLYAEIEKTFVTTTTSINKLLARLADEKNRPPANEAKHLVAKINLLACYIKRKSDLILLEKTNNKLPVNELILALNETIEFLEYLDILCACDFKLTGDISAQQAAVIYDYWENLCAWVIQHYCPEMLLRLNCKNDNLVFSVSADFDFSSFQPNPDTQTKIKALNGSTTHKKQNWSQKIELLLPKGGESNA